MADAQCLRLGEPSLMASPEVTNPCLTPGAVGRWDGNRYTYPDGDVVFIDAFKGGYRWEFHGRRRCVVSQQFVSDPEEARREGILRAEEIRAEPWP